MEFKAGKVHKTFQTKSGKACVIRWAKWDDLQQLTDFINEIAQEDTYISFSPEDDVTLEFESKFLSSVLSDGSLRRASYIVAEIDVRIRIEIFGVGTYRRINQERELCCGRG